MDRSVDEFGALFRTFLERVVQRAPDSESALGGRLTEHLGHDARVLPVTAARYATFEHPDLQLAVDDYVSSDGRRAEALGIAAGYGRHHLSLGDLLVHGHAQEGPVSYAEYPVGVDARQACMTFGILLVDDPNRSPHALVVRLDLEMRPEIVIEVIAAQRTTGVEVLDEIRSRAAARSVYRGKVFELGNKQGAFSQDVLATFLARPDVRRSDIVLPDGVLDRIERRTIGFDAVSERLRSQGQRRRRGILLYGPPGTGKTLTARYLMGAMPDRTVVVLTGASFVAIGPAVTLARRLQPSLLVLEDVDLVALERHIEMGQNPLLFELLNELDGVGGDADLLVILTTNRADLLEPALAARPGRVDLAVQLPLPDDTERRRLLELYTRDVDTAVRDWSEAVRRSAGTPASFIEELVRSATLIAAQAGDDHLGDDHVSAALDELLDSGPVTPRLLGAHTVSPPDVDAAP